MAVGVTELIRNYLTNFFLKIFVFRYQENDFKFIGADYSYLNRDSGETENRSYNFSTKKVKISTHDDSGDKEKTILRSFKYDKLKTFKTFIPFTWEIEKDFYL